MKKAKKLVINDIRKHHSSAANSFRGSPTTDPWAQSMPLSTHLATLIPSCDANYFQSAFHDPQHSSPYKALRHALQKVNDRLHPDNDTLSEQETQHLFGMFDMLRESPVYETMNAEQRDLLLSDARLALRATNGEPDIAWDLVSILTDLKRDLDVGTYHSPPTTPMPPSLFIPKSRLKSRSSASKRETSGSTMMSTIGPTPKDNDLGKSWNYIPKGRRKVLTTSPLRFPLMIQIGRQGSKELGTGLAKKGREISASSVLCNGSRSCIRTATEFCARRPSIGREGVLGIEGRLLGTLLRGLVTWFRL